MDRKLKVLYVDDEELNIMLFDINFSPKYEIFTASSGADGLAMLENNPAINVVLSDLKMPIQSGIEFIEMAKEKFPMKKYYLLTGFDNTPEIQEAINSGLVQRYFRKPFDKNEIETELNQYLNLEG